MISFRKSYFFTIWSLTLFCSVEAFAACNPKCGAGQTCRYEQPNTFYCQNINNMQGSQQGAMGNQQGAMSNQQIPSGGADQNGMRLRGKFNSRGSSSNQATSDNYGPIANGGCSDSSAACVSVRISGYETIYRSLEDAMLAILRQSLTEGRPVNAELIPNEYAIKDLSNGNKNLGPVWDMIMSHQFRDLPDDRILQDISSMIPPVSDRLRNMGLDQQTAQLNAEFGMDAMQGMMDE